MLVGAVARERGVWPLASGIVSPGRAWHGEAVDGEKRPSLPPHRALVRCAGRGLHYKILSLSSSTNARVHWLVRAKRQSLHRATGRDEGRFLPEACSAPDGAARVRPPREGEEWRGD
jgi:hypothetical protein